MPLLIDWFCGEGGAAEGYSQAGWEVIGIDAVKQPRYPHAFVLMDCVDPDFRLIRLADAHHASPPCQVFTEMNNDKSRHRNLIPITRDHLEATGKPYVIENVRAAAKHLIRPVSLFGSMFNNHMITSQGQRFDLSRERCFEANWPLRPPMDYGTPNPIANVFGGHLRARSGPYRTGGKTGRTRDFIGEDKPALARELMGMPWATMNGMSEAVPPSYTRYIGERLLEHVR